MISMKPLLSSPSRSVKRFGALMGVLAVLCGAPAFADEPAEVTKLMRAGQLPAALQRVEQALAQHPRDAQMRFLKGLILSEQNKTAEAITVFTKLTEDFPDLPEPYNNLAVLYASSGQYDRARTALESAIRTNPTYATAHENLGDIYAKLASQAYDKALQLDSGNVGAKSKLTMVRTLVGNATSAPSSIAANSAGAKKPSAVAAAPAPVVAQAPAAQAPVILNAATNKPAVAPPPAPGVKTIVVPPAATPASTVAKASPPPATAPAVVAKAEPAKAAPAPAPAPANNAEQAEVLKVVDAWAKAWSNKDVKGYLNMYHDKFQTPGGVSMKAWSEERRSRIEGKGRISVKVEAPQVTFDGNSATVKFKQAYSSDRLSSTSRKTLVLEKQGKQWQIKQERTGS
jgi:Flp pilus assembly protein TadD/ketosteroid isomerase-like protein